jgi:small neutral amino acid transporter SnatA (MarC family)
MEHWSEYTRFIITLMVILDPFMALPVFLELTRDHTQSERRGWLESPLLRWWWCCSSPP